MRVSSALEAGTVSSIVTRLVLVSSAPMNFNPTGMGKSIQYVEQQCSVWREEAVWYRYVFSTFHYPFPKQLHEGGRENFLLDRLT
jgi:hypothetical protein